MTCPVVVVQHGDNYSTQKTHLHASKPGIMTSVKIAKEVSDYIFLIIVIIIIIKVVKDLAIVLWTIVFLVIIIIIICYVHDTPWLPVIN